MKNTNEILDSFLSKLKKEIDNYKCKNPINTNICRKNGIPDFPAVNEAMKQFDFCSAILKVLDSTFNLMKLEQAPNEEYNSCLEEEKTFIDITNSYRKGILDEVGNNIQQATKEIPLDRYMKNFKKICEIYTQGIYPLKKKIEEAHLLMEELSNNSSTGLENTNLKTAYNNLKIAITNAENKLNAFSRVYSKSNLSGAMIEYGFSVSKDKDVADFDKKLKEFIDAAATIDALIKYIQKNRTK